MPAVMIHTFEGYRRFWPPLLHFVEKNVEKSIPVYFASERDAPQSDRVIHAPTGPGLFLERLERGLLSLARLGFCHVLYLQEDHWPIAGFSAAWMKGLGEWAIRHRLDSVKLGAISFTPSDLHSIRSCCDPVPEMLDGQPMHWFGSHGYPVSHQMTLFDIEFLLETIRAARWRGATSGWQHELFCQEYLVGRVKSTDGDGKDYRIATWVKVPWVDYVHAAVVGKLTPEGEAAISDYQLKEIWQEGGAGEVFPASRGVSC